MLLDEEEAIHQEAIRRTSVNLSDKERFAVTRFERLFSVHENCGTDWRVLGKNNTPN